MFGYIRPLKEELLVREYEQYRGVYCGLCRQLGKCYGFSSRMTLSYDCTFFGMMLLSRSESCGGFHKGRCGVNPLKKSPYCADDREEIKLAATVSVLLTYQKIRDDLQDGGLKKKITRGVLLPFAAHANKKAGKNHPKLLEYAAEVTRLQSEAEKDPEAGMDACAHPTGEFLKNAFQYCLEKLEGIGTEEPQSRVLGQFGYHLGRWIYIMDACDDLEKDHAKKQFNPLLRRFAVKAGEELSEEKKKEILLYANEALNMCMSQITRAFELLECIHFEPILRNIVYKGLTEMQKEILFLKKEKEHDGSL